MSMDRCSRCRVGHSESAHADENWAMWSGRLDDFQVYDYALSAEEVAYLASDGGNCFLIPLTTDAQKANLKSSGIPA